ncbi:hypothetical protein C0992_010418 [Termitomyces sp. T32_za158]|nr:hypothetical protein C0992_010418 [Termitomyces sp. T32_za158]
MKDSHRSPAQFVDLPAEVIIQIFSYLAWADAIAISSVSVFLRTCFTTSKQLQLRFASQVAAVTGNSYCQLDFNDRLRLLRRLEDGWSDFRVDFNKTLPILYEPFGIYDLTGGIYLMGDINQKVLHYCKLPSSVDDSMAWSRIDLDPSLSIVDVGLSVYEHDLIAVVSTKPTTVNPLLLRVEIQLLQFSTGKPHPLVRNPVIFVRNTSSTSTASSIGIEIVGEYLALVTTPGLFEAAARFCVFEWKTGAVLLDYPVNPGTYCNIVFLSPTHIILPNGLSGTLDLFIISPSNPNPSGPTLRLAFPVLNPGYSIRAIHGRSEPNPSPTGLPYSTRPFHPSPEDAIAIFKLHIRGDDDDDNDDTPGWGDFSMFTHRSTLLRLCEEHSGRPGGTVHWEEWGPPVTRWIDAAIVPWWITTSTGQRCVLSITPDAVGLGSAPFVMLLDFNPLAVKRALSVRCEKENEGLAVDGCPNVNVESSSMESIVFEEVVESALPYVSIARYLEKDISFDGVLMDEERLLGLATDDDGRVKKIEVFHIGADRDYASSSSFK